MGNYTFISREATGLVSSVLGDVVYCGSAVICGFRTSQEFTILIQVCSWQVFASRVCCELCFSWNPQGAGAEWDLWLLHFGEMCFMLSWGALGVSLEVWQMGFAVPRFPWRSGSRSNRIQHHLGWVQLAPAPGQMDVSSPIRGRSAAV